MRFCMLQKLDAVKASWLLCGGGGLNVILWRSSCAVEVRGYKLSAIDEVPVYARVRHRGAGVHLASSLPC